MAPFNIKAFYRNLSRTFRNGPSVPHQIANKTAAPGEYVGAPIGTALAYFKSSTNSFSNYVSHYANYSRLARYSDYGLMEQMAEIASALDIYSHETCAKGEYGEILRIESEDPKIKDVLTRLFYDTLNIEFNAATWIRSLCKYGDFFLLLDHHPDFGIVNTFPLPVNEVEREEGYDPKNPYAIRYRWLANQNKIIDAWQVVHFRMTGNDSFLPYGMSVLEPARRAWRQLILMEDAVMVYRIVRSPERRVFYIDVGNVAPNDVPAIVEQAKTNLKRNQVVDPTTGQVDLRYNALSVADDFYLPVRGQETGTRIETLAGGQFTGDIDDLQYIQNKLFAALKVPKSYLGYEGDLGAKCLAPETEIHLLDGTTQTIKSIASGIEQGKKYFVYSINEITHQTLASEIIAAKKTRLNAQLVRVTLDNRQHVRCTPDHKFMLRDGTYCEAQYLQAGQSLMPLYTRLSTKDDDKFVVGYEMYLDANTQKYEFTHRMVAEHFRLKRQGKVIHHADFNKRNNNPTNLDCSMTWVEHRKYHQQHARKILCSPEAIKRLTEHPDRLERCSRGGKLGCKALDKWRALGNRPTPWNKGVTSETNIKMKAIADTITKYKTFISCGNPDCTEVFREKYSRNSSNKLRQFCSPECSSKIRMKERRDREHNLYWTTNTCLTCQRLFETRIKKNSKFCSMYCRRAYQDYKKPKYKTRDAVPTLELLKNHKVVSIEWLTEREDCYDIEVANNNNTQHPNFALKCGVYVHNSSLSQQDVRFARTIQHIQRIFLAELEKIAMIQLYTMGLRDEQLLDFQLSMANPSAINEIQRLELWRTRFEVASIATTQEGLLDKKFFYKHILHLNDAEIESIEEGRRKDKLIQLEIDSMQLPMDVSEDLGAGQPGLGGAEGTGAPTEPEANPQAADTGSVTNNVNAPLDNNAPQATGEARDPNVQRAIPNDLRVKKPKPRKPDSDKALVYRTKKNGLDPRDELGQLRRVATSPFGEADRQYQRLNKHTDFIDMIEKKLDSKKLL